MMFLRPFVSLLATLLSLVVITNGLPGSDASVSLHETRDDGNHAFTFKELSPTSPTHSNQQKYFRAGVCFKYNKNLTEEAYHKYWKTIHADKCMGTKDFTLHIYRYNQFHIDSKSKEALQPLIDQGMKYTEFDGCAEFHTPDAASFVEFFSILPDYIRKDEENFVDEDLGLYLMAGYENVIYGSGIKTSRGTNGIMPGDERLPKD